MLRYSLKFVGRGQLPRSDRLYRDLRLVAGTIVAYRAERFLVESINGEADPPVAVLRKVPS